MGAYEFSNEGVGKDVNKVFRSLVEQAAWDNGHAGYTGTIAATIAFWRKRLDALCDKIN